MELVGGAGFDHYEYRTSTDGEDTNRYLGVVYLELGWDVFFDNTFGGAHKRSVSESAKD